MFFTLSCTGDNNKLILMCHVLLGYRLEIITRSWAISVEMFEPGDLGLVEYIVAPFGAKTLWITFPQYKNNEIDLILRQ